MIIGFSGKIGSGKDLAGTYLQYVLTKEEMGGRFKAYTPDTFETLKEETRNLLSKSEIHKFGGPLKDMVCILLGCTREDLENREFKNQKLGKEWDDLTPRQIMQLLGTEAGRVVIHPNIWVNAALVGYREQKRWEMVDSTNIGRYPKYILTDVRFPNEVQAIEELGGIVIRIERDGLVKSDHVSETALDGWTFEHIIENNGTKEEFYQKIEYLYKEQLKKMVV